jgi:hypothetical protein
VISCSLMEMERAPTAPEHDCALQAPIGSNRKPRRKSNQVELLDLIDQATKSATTEPGPIEQMGATSSAGEQAKAEQDILPLTSETAESSDDLIADLDAARRVEVAINAMRVAENDNARLLAVRDCSRALDPVEHHDAIVHLVIFQYPNFA